MFGSENIVGIGIGEKLSGEERQEIFA